MALGFSGDFFLLRKSVYILDCEDFKCEGLLCVSSFLCLPWMQLKEALIHKFLPCSCHSSTSWSVALVILYLFANFEKSVVINRLCFVEHL